jgi:hypothetical protein
MNRILFEMSGSEDGEFDFRLESIIEEGMIGFKLMSISREAGVLRCILRLEPTRFEREFLHSVRDWEAQIERWDERGIGNWYGNDPQYKAFLRACLHHIVDARTIHQVMTA